MSLASPLEHKDRDHSPGNITRPARTPHLPIRPEQIANECPGACEAGAAQLQIHMRTPLSDRPLMDVKPIATSSTAFASTTASSRAKNEAPGPARRSADARNLIFSIDGA
ncbi:3-keto-5-aminohexanoate cleavage protein [Bradyrhizobium sp. Pear77]|uniref:3-keto-5-aminohexanoate cleavage protein n=1 Tax=Bradyrhizobium altum TaxID=1571202 RepID=UPI001E43171D|nr:3-keto-5-aminohexanoate cleavage protein [Bradyrhizobium altum]MCC8960121.1 3-keto-5-aminohexanoate cleavage protein [Bradyrhizobium altum]